MSNSVFPWAARKAATELHKAKLDAIDGIRKSPHVTDRFDGKDKGDRQYLWAILPFIGVSNAA